MEAALSVLTDRIETSAEHYGKHSIWHSCEILCSRLRRCVGSMNIATFAVFESIV